MNPHPVVGRIAVFGDVQGHADVFGTALDRLGVDTDSGVVPPDLTVVQAGDLIHKGPDSEATVALADRLLRSSPDRYVQLAGNHEGQYLGGPDFWADTIDETAAVTMAGWFIERKMQIAWALDETVLISHGGMSVDKWVALGRPGSAIEAALALNDEFFANPSQALRPGRMLRGEVGPPGVAWTEPTAELYDPWFRHGAPPFSQVHGHASPYHWASGRWFAGVPRRQRRSLRLDPDARQSALEIGACTFFGIDTGFGHHEPDAVICPLVFGFDALGQQTVEVGP